MEVDFSYVKWNAPNNYQKL